MTLRTQQIVPAIICVLACAFVIRAQTAEARDAIENGRITERKTLEFPAYDSKPELRREFKKDEYEAATNDQLSAERIVYSSDGFRVVAYLYGPKKPGDKLPVIVFNRGGYVRGEIAHELAVIFHRLSKHGFLVVAPLYRGSGGAEGKDEVGGGDLADLMNVIPLIRSLPAADANNIFLYGESRGGMMVYQAIRDGFPANAAATYGSFSDFDGLVSAHSAQYLPLLRSIWTDYDTRRGEINERRSATKWVEKLNVPLLLMHGGSDRTLDPMQTIKFAEKLQTLKKPYELIIYSGDNHSISMNQIDRDGRTAAWFRKHIK